VCVHLYTYICICTYRYNSGRIQGRTHIWLFFCHAKDQTQGRRHGKKVLYHWDIPPAHMTHLYNSSVKNWLRKNINQNKWEMKKPWQITIGKVFIICYMKIRAKLSASNSHKTMHLCLTSNTVKMFCNWLKMWNWAERRGEKTYDDMSSSFERGRMLLYVKWNYIAKIKSLWV
jgi:hypothetical protein